jgi:predicted ATP-binding protein involved in virulence
MRIDRIHLKNFKLFEDFELTLHPEFTLLIGENGSGKTSVLDGLAIACGVWLYDVPDSKIANSRLSLSDAYIRLEAQRSGDRIQFVEALDTIVAASGELLNGHREQWTQEIRFGTRSKQNLRQARTFIEGVFKQASEGTNVTLPVIAYYGAGRAWLPHKERSKEVKPSFAHHAGGKPSTIVSTSEFELQTLDSGFGTKPRSVEIVRENTDLVSRLSNAL